MFGCLFGLSRPVRSCSWYVALISLHAILWSSISYAGGPCDLDDDGICDTDEQRWLDLYAPIFYTDRIENDFAGGVGIPVEVDWLLRHSKIYQVHEINGNAQVTLIASYPTQAEFRAILDDWDSIPGAEPFGANWWVDNEETYGADPMNPRTWGDAVAVASGSFGRAWLPWPFEHPNLVALQYMLYLTHNETAFVGDIGNHEGDWVALDITIDTQANADRPPIIHAVYHNHGRQHFVSPEAIHFEQGRPVAYLERGTNELWPNPGGRGKDGWPMTDGWATNVDLDDACENGIDVFFDSVICAIIDQIGDINEHKISREHSGGGRRYDFAAGDGIVNNLGERHNHLGSDEEWIVANFEGRWGSSNEIAGENPKSPVFQDKIWWRGWFTQDEVLGPWSIARGPFEAADLPGFVPNTLPGFQFDIPQRLPNVYVDGASLLVGNGTPSRPYRTLDLGVALTQDHGAVHISPGVYPGTKLYGGRPVEFNHLGGAGEVVIDP